jgi:ATP-dependent Lon protease
VMPIGGLKEKLLAAHRSGITLVILPRENRKDLREVPRRVLRATRLVLVEHMDEVLREALVLPPGRELFGGSVHEKWEYIDGELVVTPANAAKPAAPAEPRGLEVPADVEVPVGKTPPPKPSAPLPV